MLRKGIWRDGKGVGRDGKEEGAWEGLERKGIWTSKNSWGLSPPTFKILAPPLTSSTEKIRLLLRSATPAVAELLYYIAEGISWHSGRAIVY